MLKNKQRLLFAAILAAVPFTVQANITVNGELNDWLNAPTGSGSSSDWTDFNNSNDIYSSNVSKMIEDNHPDNSYLGPGTGAKYDTEAMYLNFNNSSNTLNIAIVTALAPSTHDRYSNGMSVDSAGNYVAGDILFDLDGGTGFDYAMIVTPHVVYEDSYIGDVSSGSLLKAKSESGAGSDAWRYGLDHTGNRPDGETKYDHASQIKIGVENLGEVTNVGSANAFYYNELTTDNFNNIGGLGGQHYLIETSITFAEGDGDYGDAFLTAIRNGDLNVHFNPTCDNDYLLAGLNYNAPGVPSPGSIPEPGSLALVALGLIGFGVKKRRS